MKAGLATLCAALALSGCVHMGAVQDVYTYDCENGEVVRAGYRGKEAALVYGGRNHRLTVALSASGTRYVGEGLQWWTRGLTEGMLAPLKPGEEIASAPSVTCKVRQGPM